MAELSEEELSIKWLAIADQDPARWKDTLNAFSKNQPDLWKRWAQMPQEIVAVGVQLACASCDVLVHHHPTPRLDDAALLRSEKRLQSLLPFLLKRLRKGETLDAALNEAGDNFPLRQWALMGILADTLLSEIDQESISSEAAAHVFTELAIQIDALDRAITKR